MSIIQSFQEYLADVAPSTLLGGSPLLELVKERTKDMWLATFDEFAGWVEETLASIEPPLAAQLQEHAQTYLSLYEGDPEEEAQRVHVLHETPLGNVTEQTFVYYDERPTDLERPTGRDSERPGSKVFVHCLWRGLDGQTVQFSSCLNRALIAGASSREAKRAYKALMWRLTYWVVRNHLPPRLVQCVEQVVYQQ